jgi:hypothetical protein
VEGKWDQLPGRTAWRGQGEPGPDSVRAPLEACLWACDMVKSMTLDSRPATNQSFGFPTCKTMPASWASRGLLRTQWDSHELAPWGRWPGSVPWGTPAPAVPRTHAVHVDVGLGAGLHELDPVVEGQLSGRHVYTSGPTAFLRERDWDPASSTVHQGDWGRGEFSPGEPGNGGSPSVEPNPAPSTGEVALVAAGGE